MTGNEYFSRLPITRDTLEARQADLQASAFVSYEPRDHPSRQITYLYEGGKGSGFVHRVLYITNIQRNVRVGQLLLLTADWLRSSQNVAFWTFTDIPLN